jgi:hypothetical protein
MDVASLPSVAPLDNKARLNFGQFRYFAQNRSTVCCPLWQRYAQKNGVSVITIIDGILFTLHSGRVGVIILSAGLRNEGTMDFVSCKSSTCAGKHITEEPDVVVPHVPGSMWGRPGNGALYHHCD